MSGLQSPQILTDLYRDLRDRRLLPLVLVLVVGMAVVPIALSSSSEPPAATPPPPARASAKSNAPTEQIVVSDPGVRDYQRRLSGDASTDPFVQEFTSPTVIPGSSSPTGAGSAATGTSTGATTGESTPPTGSSGGSATQPQTQSRYYYYRIKVRAGEAGKELKTHDSVGPLDPLPSKAVPALSFLGVTTDSSFNAKTAVFLVSSAVSSAAGEGSCTFAGTYCQLLSLQPGQHEDLVWTNGVVYRIQLVNFDLVARKQLPDIGSGDGNSGSGDGNSGAGRTVGRHFTF